MNKAKHNKASQNNKVKYKAMQNTTKQKAEQSKTTQYNKIKHKTNAKKQNKTDTWL